MKKNKSTHPDWVINHKKPGTEIKRINDKYYLYGVKSMYDKTIKRSKKISLGILGSITKEYGFIPSSKNELKAKSVKTYLDKNIFIVEYGLAKYFFDEIQQDNVLQKLKLHFPHSWKFIVALVYCRLAYKSPLKNIPFNLEQSAIMDLLEWDEKLNDQKICDFMYNLGSNQHSIHEFLRPIDNHSKTVLMDATHIVLQSNNICLAQKGYNANFDYLPQITLLYIYDATTLKPLYYRMLPGNIREISALKNTLKMSGLESSVFIADKGFFSDANITELEKIKMQYIIPLKRDNKNIPYQKCISLEQTDNYFEYNKRFIFFSQHQIKTLFGKRNLVLFLDGKLKEQEKTDYLRRILSFPEEYSKENFNKKIIKMGTMAILHNTEYSSQEIYFEYKGRCEIEQFFDHLKNTLEADSSNMQREESLYGWMFINHLAMLIVYRLFNKLKTIPLNKKQKLIHKYSIQDVLQHLQTIKKIKIDKNDKIICEINKYTKELLKYLKLSIT